MISSLYMKNRALYRGVVLALLLVLVVLGTTMCSTEDPTEEPAAAPTEAPVEVVEEEPMEEPMEEEREDEMAMEMMDTTLAIEHFSPIEGTTWSGAHNRAGERLAEKYPEVTYIYREAVGPDLTVPYAEEMISDGATIVIGNAEFLNLLFQLCVMQI